MKPRSATALLGIALLAAAGLAVSGWERVLDSVSSAAFALPVDIEATGATPEQAERITVWCRDGAGKVVELSRYQSRLRWRANFWLTDPRLAAPREIIGAIGGLRVRIGDRVATFDAAQIAAWRSDTTPATLSNTLGAPLESLRIPAEGYGPINAVNWPRTKTLGGEILSSLALLPAGVCLAALFLFLTRRPGFRAFVARALGGPMPAPARDVRWTAGGFVFVALCLAFLEWRQPFYFTQDDNYSQFLPVIAGGCRTLFSGHLPLWNPHQYMGSPTMTLGVYALTYPFTYVAWLIAAALGNENLTIEVFAIGHILAGFLLTARMLSRFGFRPATAASGAVCIALSGFALVFGRSWYYMLPVLVWTPLLVMAVEKLAGDNEKISWRWAAGTGLAIGLFFHAGNAQMWSYAVLFFAAAIAWGVWARRIPVKRALWALPALLLGVALAAPVLLTQMAETANIERRGGTGLSIAPGLAHLWAPLGRLIARRDIAGYALHSEMFYIGLPLAVLMPLGILLLGGALALCRTDRGAWRRLIGSNVWLLCAAIALVLAMGRTGVLWPLMSSLPVFDKFNVPTKFMGFVTPFAIIGGGAILERLTRDRRRAPAFAAACALCLTAVHVALATHGFYDFGGRPYTPLPPEFSAALRSEPGGRVLTVGPDRSVDPLYAWSLRLNLATAEGATALDGYDPLVAARPEDRAVAERLDSDTPNAAAAYGARWALVDESGFQWRFGDEPSEWTREVTNPADEHRWARLKPLATPAAHVPGFTLYRLQKTAPLAFAAERPDVALPVQMDWSGARVQTGNLPAGSRVVLNVTRRRWMTLASDAAGALPWKTDAWGRVSFIPPAGAREVRMTYSPPWGRGFAASFALALMAAATGWLLSQGQRPAPPLVACGARTPACRVETLLDACRAAPKSSCACTAQRGGLPTGLSLVPIPNGVFHQRSLSAPPGRR